MTFDFHKIFQSTEVIYEHGNIGERLSIDCFRYSNGNANVLSWAIAGEINNHIVKAFSELISLMSDLV